MTDRSRSEAALVGFLALALFLVEGTFVFGFVRELHGLLKGFFVTAAPGAVLLLSSTWFSVLALAERGPSDRGWFGLVWGSIALALGAGVCWYVGVVSM